MHDDIGVGVFSDGICSIPPYFRLYVLIRRLSLRTGTAKKRMHKKSFSMIYMVGVRLNLFFSSGLFLLLGYHFLSDI